VGFETLGERDVNSYQLPRTVIPARYELRLEPDLASATFAGEVVIAVTVQQSTSEIVLNAIELGINNARIETVDGRSLAAVVTLEEKTERCRFAFAESVPPGDGRLHVRFRGILNDTLRGFYRSSYEDARGATKVLAATQFEATDARRAFPCWDEPAFKAVFATTLVIDPALLAVSNTAIASNRIENG